MSNYETLEKQFNAIVSNCEVSTTEYEMFILDKAENVIQGLYYQAEDGSIDEAITEVAKQAIKALRRAFGYEPF